jgi:ferredoxin
MTTLEPAGFEQLIAALASEGYRIIGPTVRGSAVVYDDITSAEAFPIGWADDQEGGAYRLKKTDSPAYFDYTLSPQSWKRFLFPPAVRLWQAQRSGSNIDICSDANGNLQPERLAFVGVRPCELSAIAIQDRVFMGHDYADPHYSARHEHLFIVAVNCTQSAATCFCASINTGPQADSGFDIALTEVVENDRHYFLAESGSERGAALLESLPQTATTPAEAQAAAKRLHDAAQTQVRSINTKSIKDRLYRSYEHPRWDDAGERCLMCGNCTMVCPTCFCTTVEDVTDLSGDTAERWRKWDSCFSLDFSYIYGGSLRTSSKARYRQWLMHKLATWQDQFGSLGCVGCGRCITWCPVGIDITEEARAIQATEPATPRRKRAAGGAQ